MSLRTQILLGYGLVLVLAGVTVAFSLASIARLGDASSAILSDNYRSIRAAQTIADALERQDSAVLLALSGDASRRPASDPRQRRPRPPRARRGAGQPDRPRRGRGRRLGRRAYGAYAARLAAAPSLGSYVGELFPAFERAKRSASALRDLNQGAMVAASDEATRVGRRAVASVGTVAGLTLALGVGLSLLLASRVTRPARRLREAAERVAGGDLDVTVPGGRTDELGALAAAFNAMTERLRAYRALDVDRLVAEQGKGAAVIESVRDGLVVVLADGTVDRMNPAAAAALGSDARAATGQQVDRVAGDALGALVRRAALGSAAPERTAASAPAFIDSPDGARHYEPVASPVRTPDGALVGAVLVLRDVTGLRELDRLKSAFVATASHELKTPLTSMTLSVGLLQDRVGATLGERDRALLAAAAEDVGRLGGLVRDLLDLSRIDAGQLDLHVAPTPVAELVAPAVRGIRAQAEQAGVALTVDVPDLVAAADARQVGQRADEPALQRAAVHAARRARPHLGAAGRTDGRDRCVGRRRGRPARRPADALRALRAGAGREGGGRQRARARHRPRDRRGARRHDPGRVGARRRRDVRLHPAG